MTALNYFTELVITIKKIQFVESFLKLKITCEVSQKLKAAFTLGNNPDSDTCLHGGIQLKFLVILLDCCNQNKC